MKTTGIIAGVALIGAIGLTLHVALAQQPGFNRFDLQRHDLSIPGREMIQVRVEIDPGTASPRHTHRAKRSSMSSKARSSTRSKEGRR